MTEPALKIDKKIEAKVSPRIPRLNERVFVDSFYTNDNHFEEHCKVIRLCGLTAEIEVQKGSLMRLWAARRRGRNKHD